MRSSGDFAAQGHDPRSDNVREHPASPELPELFEALYAQLRVLAERHFRSQPAGAILQPTALVHEVFLKLARSHGLRINNSEHFLAIAARAMRQVLVDDARRRESARSLMTVDPGLLHPSSRTSTVVDVLCMDEAIELLRNHDKRKAAVLECRLFAGLSIEQTAAALGVARSTVAEDWRFARAWVASRVRPAAIQ